MFNGKCFHEKFLPTRKYYDFTWSINCTCKLTCMCACTCACDRMCLREQYELEEKKAAILSNSVVGICPELSGIKVKIKKKEFPGFILEKHLYGGLRELCDL